MGGGGGGGMVVFSGGKKGGCPGLPNFQKGNFKNIVKHLQTCPHFYAFPNHLLTPESCLVTGDDKVIMSESAFWEDVTKMFFFRTGP